MGYVSSKEGDYARAAKLGAECGGDTLKNNLTARAKRHVVVHPRNRAEAVYGGSATRSTSVMPDPRCRRHRVGSSSQVQRSMVVK